MSTATMCRQKRPRVSRLSGFSLIELMIAMTIALVVIGVVTASYTSMANVSRTTSRSAEYQTNGRYALDFLKTDLMHAGFINFTAGKIERLGGTETTNYGCGANFVTNIEQPVGGANDVNPYSSCIDGGALRNRVRGDILVVRRLSQTPVTVLAASTLYFRSAYEVGQIYTTATSLGVLRAPTQIYALQASIYYISPYSTGASESPQVPALYRLALGTGPQLTPELVAPNVENFQAQYGVRTETPGSSPATYTTRYLNADQLVPADWPNVQSVRIWLLTRATTAEPGYTNTNTYVMGDQTITVNDGFQRELHQVAVQLRR